MLRGFYTAASGMIAQQRQQEALSNNISNANTPGYKADQSSLRAFPEMLMHEMTSSNLPVKNGGNIQVRNPIGPLNTGVYVQEMVPDFKQGDVEETGISTDLAIINGTLPDDEGGLFFTLQNGAGDKALTRNGNFTVDGDSFLVTTEGYYVLDEADNPVQTDGMDFTVTEDGNLQAGEQTIPLQIAYAPDANELEKTDEGLFVGESEPAEEATFTIQQGAIEQSNVNALESMTQMMESYRSFETNQRVLKAYDDSLGKAVNDVGRIG